MSPIYSMDHSSGEDDGETNIQIRGLLNQNKRKKRCCSLRTVAIVTLATLMAFAAGAGGAIYYGYSSIQGQVTHCYSELDSVRAECNNGIAKLQQECKAIGTICYSLCKDCAHNNRTID